MLRELAAALFVAASTVALADLTPHQQYQTTGTSAAAEVEIDRNMAQVYLDDQYDDDALNAVGHSYSAANYPFPVITAPGAVTSEHAAGYSHSMAELDLPAGRLRAYSLGGIFSGSDSASYVRANGRAQVGISDTLTIDKPARISIVGQVHGRMEGMYTGNANKPTARVTATFGFWEFVGGESPFELDATGMSQNLNLPYEPVTIYPVPGDSAPETVVPFSKTYDLPAGSYRFSAYLETYFSMFTGPGGSTMTHLAFDNTASFQVLVPEDVIATSTSGHLPIAVPEPTSLALLGLCALGLIRRRA